MVAYVRLEDERSGAGTLRALLDAGLQPGRDLSLIVLDGVAEGLALPVPRRHAGRAHLVLDVLAGMPVQGLHHLLQPRLEPGATDTPLRLRETAGCS